MQLYNLQKAFSAALLTLETQPLVPYIIANGLTPEQRLQIYRNNIINNCTQALRAVYPTVERLVGADFFNAAAREYVRQYPSTFCDLQQYGDKLAEFLATFPPAKTVPYLAEVAQFEWGYHLALHAAAHSPLDLIALGQIAPDDYHQVKFSLHPATRLFAMQFPVSYIWQLCQAEEDPNDQITLPEHGEKILMLRPKFEVEWRFLSEGEYALLSAFTQQKEMGQACAEALEVEPNFDVGQFLQFCIANLIITEFVL